jgi:hypothetical protein
VLVVVAVAVVVVRAHKTNSRNGACCDAPGAQGQQPGKSKKAVKSQVAPDARLNTAKGNKRDNSQLEPLEPLGDREQVVCALG